MHLEWKKLLFLAEQTNLLGLDSFLILILNFETNSNRAAAAFQKIARN